MISKVINYVNNKQRFTKAEVVAIDDLHVTANMTGTDVDGNALKERFVFDLDKAPFRLTEKEKQSLKTKDEEK
ncbi:MAG: hypothetical protein PHC43_01610 [Candidatus Marinimicrobia bacterium]|jgi:hypothetical protein|nr:hypothetical protein [Candidatus Neomarinimicrobiota bacterium]MDD5230005.1 hypothetical protein [Candidatus Neomarinimicrobiota bacterium]